MNPTPTRAASSVELDDYVNAIAWSPDGRRLAAVSLAGDLAIANLTDHGPGAGVGSFSGAVERHTGLHPSGALSLAWSPDGAVLATGGQDGFVRLHGPDGYQAGLDLGGWVGAVAWSPTDPNRLAAAAGRTTSLLTARGELISTDTAAATVTSVAWSPNGRRLGAASYGGVTWHDPDNGAVLKRFDWKGSILTLAMAPNGKWAATGNQDSSVHVWRLWTAEDMEMTGYAAKIQHLAWDPTSRWLCVGDIGEVTCWDFSGRGPRGSRPRTLSGHTRRITALSYAGPRLASASADGTIRVWRPPSTRPEAVIDLGEEISTLAWHPDGRTLAAGLADGRLQVTAADG